VIKDENGVLVGYVFADIDQTQRDLGGWVDDAKAIVARQLALPAGYRLQWTGQYEFLAEMEARLRYVIPLSPPLLIASPRRCWVDGCHSLVEIGGGAMTRLRVCCLEIDLASSLSCIAAPEWRQVCRFV